MNIHSITKSATSHLSGIRNRLFDLIPNTTVNTPEKFNKMGVVLSRPDVNRLIMGATALLTQPLIDYYNPNVDEDTAKTSTCRTIGKIVAGTAVGCGVRSLCFYTTKLLTSGGENGPAWRKWLLPSNAIVRYLNKRHGGWLKKYNNTISTLLGLVAMLFTNVALDVPLTNKISKALMDFMHIKQEPAEPNPTNANNNPVRKEEHKPYDVKEKFRDIFLNDGNFANGRRESV